MEKGAPPMPVQYGQSAAYQYAPQSQVNPYPYPQQPNVPGVYVVPAPQIQVVGYAQPYAHMQPGQGLAAQPGVPGRWSSNTFDICVDGQTACCVGCCCAPCVVAEHSRLVGWNPFLMGTCFCLLYSPSYLLFVLFGFPFGLPLSCVVHAPLRKKIRQRYGIEEACCLEDWLCTTFCIPCSLCQEQHEIIVHGERGYRV